MHDTFYFTDVHGRLDFYRAMRKWCYDQDPEAMIVYGGDACDRGPSGYQIMKEILDDPYIIYIRGNHEQMFIDAARSILKQYPNAAKKFSSVDELIQKLSNDKYVRLSVYNGSKPTLEGWLQDGFPESFIDRLDAQMRTVFDINQKICFSHAGGTAAAWARVWTCEYNGLNIDAFDKQEMIWDRDYLDSNWPEGKIIIFGHTPTMYINEEYGLDMVMDETTMKPISYFTEDSVDTGMHIAMDTGMVWSKRGYVLNCNTLKAHGFYIDAYGIKKNFDVINLRGKVSR